MFLLVETKSLHVLCNRITEADINASANQPSVASSWAGWAVTAVTSKFYKAPLDKVNNEGEGNTAVAVNGSVVSNLAANSNCSNSETPSTSLLKEGSDASWDVSNWGDMSVSTQFNLILIRKYFLLLLPSYFFGIVLFAWYLSVHRWKSVGCLLINK